MAGFTCQRKKKIAGIKRYLLVHVCPSSLSFSCRMLAHTASPFPARVLVHSACSSSQHDKSCKGVQLGSVA